MKREGLEQLRSRGTPLLLIDVREPDEYRDGLTQPDFVNIPMGKMFTEAANGALQKNATIVVVCKTGGRSEIVARELLQKGYDIMSLEGGIESLRKTNT